MVEKAEVLVFVDYQGNQMLKEHPGKINHKIQLTNTDLNCHKHSCHFILKKAGEELGFAFYHFTTKKARKERKIQFAATDKRPDLSKSLGLIINCPDCLDCPCCLRMCSSNRADPGSHGNTSGALKDDLINRGNIDLDLCTFICPVNLNYEQIFKLKIQIILRTNLRTLCGAQDTCQCRSEQGFS